MAAMEGVVGAQDQQPSQQPPARVVEKLNPAVQQQLNLESVKTRAISLFKAISRILEDFDTIARTNAVPKWLAILPICCSTCNFCLIIGIDLKQQSSPSVSFVN